MITAKYETIRGIGDNPEVALAALIAGLSAREDIPIEERPAVTLTSPDGESVIVLPDLLSAVLSHRFMVDRWREEWERMHRPDLPQLIPDDVDDEDEEDPTEEELQAAQRVRDHARIGGTFREDEDEDAGVLVNADGLTRRYTVHNPGGPVAWTEDMGFTLDVELAQTSAGVLARVYDLDEQTTATLRGRGFIVEPST